MTSHLLTASLPLVFVAALIAFQRLLPPLLIAAAWALAVLIRSPVAARHFRSMLRLRIGARWDRRILGCQGGF